MTRTFAVFGVVAAMVAVCPRATAAQPVEHDVGSRVAAEVRAYDRLGIFDDVAIDVADGHVRLTGRVTLALKKQEIGSRVSRLEGVISVSNDIGVLPVSPVDDRLRRVVANAIYSHPNFWRYAERPLPPIHIIIEHQHVTLTGNVEEPGDRVLAASLAQVSGVLSVSNQLVVWK